MKVLEKAKLPSIITTLKHTHLCWLDHLHWVYDGCIAVDLLYGELVDDRRPLGQPRLKFKDICKRDLHTFNIYTAS